MPSFSVGEKVPDVVTPDRLVVVEHRHVGTQHAAADRAQSAQQTGAGPASFSASSASRPQNASFFHPIAQPQRACSGEMSRDSSWPCSG